MIIIDATDTILGRLASYAAKKALLGEEVFVINSEKAIISGRKAFVIDKYLNDMSRGTYKGPFIPKVPNMLVRRTIRGMLPHHKYKGKNAYHKVKCFVGVPELLKDKKAEKIKGANISKLPYLYYINVGELCKRMGAKR